jgi:hypothetical protein
MRLLSFSEFILERENKLINAEPLNEGGAYGHLTHPFEDLGLTMQDVKDMIDATVEGAFGPENFVQEKCLAGDTMVTLKNRGDVTIEELVKNQYEDDILTINDLGEVEWKPIMDWVDNGPSDDWLIIELEDGRNLTVTPNHRIFLEGFDVKAEELKVGDELIVI